MLRQTTLQSLFCKWISFARRPGHELTVKGSDYCPYFLTRRRRKRPGTMNALSFDGTLSMETQAFSLSRFSAHQPSFRKHSNYLKAARGESSVQTVTAEFRPNRSLKSIAANQYGGSFSNFSKCPLEQRIHALRLSSSLFFSSLPSRKAFSAPLTYQVSTNHSSAVHCYLSADEDFDESDKNADSFRESSISNRSQPPPQRNRQGRAANSLLVSTDAQDSSGEAKGSIGMLRASEIKEILTLGGVDFRDCLEKEDFVARLEETKDYVPLNAKALLARYLYLQSHPDESSPSGSNSSNNDSSNGVVNGLNESYDDSQLASDLTVIPPPEVWWMDAERNMIEVFQAASPSVVNISTNVMMNTRLSTNPIEVPQGSGSGFIWDRSGHVVTNYHVIMRQGNLRVTLSDATTWDAEVVGRAPNRDLALLKIKAPAHKLTPVKLGRSQGLRVGQHVLAIGNPFGLDRTLTSGIISGVGREFKAVTGRLLRGNIQTDASINPGNSGGPLLDSRGRLIGVNTAIFSTSGSSSGIGFAIPVDTVRRTVTSLLKTGVFMRPGLGITCASDQQSKQLGLAPGVMVMEVLNGPSEAILEGAIRDTTGRVILGDVITAINGKPVRTVEELISAVEEHSVDETVRVTVRRRSRTMDVYIKLSAMAD
eukprot:TRINITY_DN26514_c0_g1_i1.p1 TRINITY_DN26514_c0_g1~~TRINITY_DN26514_c0_g1_i1.p1  ORF type:complete len:652 (-),score=82.65 TRINITY_DN26514_c0_g1_i1:512-2467(-)